MAYCMLLTNKRFTLCLLQFHKFEKTQSVKLGSIVFPAFFAIFYRNQEFELFAHLHDHLHAHLLAHLYAHLHAHLLAHLYAHLHAHLLADFLAHLLLLPDEL